MRKRRMDEWTGKDDEILVEIVLKHIREGSTQLKAFDEAADVLERTASACGFRWNGTVRHSFINAFNHTMKQRGELKKNKQPKSKESKPKPEIEILPKEKLQIAPKDISTLEVKEFKGQRVVTFKDIDEVHGRTEGTARKNFSNNKRHFVEGEDYFYVKPSDVNNFPIQINSAGTILFTESGYLMLVKSFTDDLAWEVQRNLVKSYFKVQQLVKQQMVPSYMVDDPIKRAEMWIEEQKQKLMLEQQVKEYQPKVTYYDLILQSTDTINITQIAKDYGLSGKALNQILNEDNVQYKMNGQWLLYSKHQDKGYTKSFTTEYVKTNGEIGTSLHTKWTQKGRLFIHNLLSKRGIEPLMDREIKEA